MRVKTLSCVGSAMVLAASLSAAFPVDAAELWEIFAPAVKESAPCYAVSSEPEAVFAADFSGTGGVTPTALAVVPRDETATDGVTPRVEEPITPMVFASDRDADSSFPGLTLPSVTPAELDVASPTGEKELWAIFAPPAEGKGYLDGSIEDPTDTASSLAEVRLESGEVLRVTQAMEEVPTPHSEALTFPSPAKLNATGETTLDRPIFSLTLDASVRTDLMEGIANLDGDRAIQDLAVEKFGSWEAPDYEASMAAGRFAGREFHWAAPAFYSRPLYFEQPNLERYGHHVAFCEHDNLTPSAISAAHFFATVPVLPHAMGAATPDECSYVLGSYRPGSCNPHQLVMPRKSLKGLIFEGIAVTGLVFLIP